MDTSTQVTDLHVRDWILDVLGIEDEKMRSAPLMEILKEGALLIDLVNIFIRSEDNYKKPKRSVSELSIVRSYENTNKFLNICQIYFQLPMVVLFSYNDFKNNNIAAVTKSLLSLHSTVIKRDGLVHPHIKCLTDTGLSSMRSPPKLVIATTHVPKLTDPVVQRLNLENDDAEIDLQEDEGNELDEMRMKCKDLESKCKQLSKLTEDHKKLEDKYSQLKQDVENSKTAEEEREEYKLKLIALEQKSKLITSEMQHWQDDCTEWQSKYSTIHGKLTEAEQRHKDQLESIKSRQRDTADFVLAPLRGLKQEYGGFRQQIQEELSKMKQHAMSTSAQILHRIKDSETEHNERYTEVERKYLDLQLHCAKLQAEQKKLLNQVIEAKGNIRVFCRVRPLKKKESSDGSSMKLLNDQELVIKNNLFKFDSVFGAKSTQEDIFTETKPFVQACVEGYNVCMFAYGQTGAGKTYTMEGTPENRGMNYRCTEKLFDMMEERKNVFSFKVSVSIVEIYIDKVLDLLLSPEKYNTQQKLKIKQNAEYGMYIPGLTEVDVTSSEEIMELLQKRAAVNRRTNATKMNQASSRSHCVMMVAVVATRLSDNVRTRGKMIMVDLAGSERVNRSEVTGEQFKEATAINKSLSALGNVISSLQHKNSHIPYRDSKLTYLLQDTLGGQSKCLMFCQISPAMADAGESLCTLKFASRVASVELGEAKKNVKAAAVNSKELDRLRQANRQISMELDTFKRQKQKANNSVQKLEQEKQSLEMKIDRQQSSLKAKDREMQGLRESMAKAEQRYRMQTRRSQDARKKEDDKHQHLKQIREIEMKAGREKKELARSLDEHKRQIMDLEKQLDVKSKKCESLKSQVRTLRKSSTSLGSLSYKRRESTSEMRAPSSSSISHKCGGSGGGLGGGGGVATIEESNSPPQTPARPVLHQVRSINGGAQSSAVHSITKQRREWTGSLFGKGTPAASRMRARMIKRSSSPSQKIKNSSKKLHGASSSSTSEMTIDDGVSKENISVSKENVGGNNNNNKNNTGGTAGDVASSKPSTTTNTNTAKPTKKRVRFNASVESRTISSKSSSASSRMSAISRRIKSKRGATTSYLSQGAKRMTVRKSTKRGANKVGWNKF